MLVDDIVMQVTQALHDDQYRNIPEEEEPTEFTLDPVARLTDENTINNSRMPEVVLTRVQTRARERHEGVARKAQEGPVDPIIDVPNYMTMTTGGFVRKMLAREGLEYEWGGTSKSTGFDCSGIIWKIMTNNGFKNFPRHSSAIYEHSKKISLKKAINTRGAILYTPGHIAISLGNGKTIEAGSEASGVNINTAHGRFTHGGLLPELKIGKAPQEASRSKVKTKPIFRSTSDPLNRLTGGASALVTAPMVFGSIIGEVYEPKVVRQGRKPAQEGPAGLGFVPAKYRGIIKDAADRYGLSARLLAVIARHESGFDPNAVSSAGAQGLFQVMPLHGLENPFNPRANAMKGAAIFASYLEKANGNLRLALAYYNAGPNASRDVIEARMRAYSDPILQEFRGGV